MERPPGIAPRVRERQFEGPESDDVMPSRRQALEALSRALAKRTGLVLLTGEPGVGKSWLCRLLERRAPASWHWLSVDLSPNLGVHGVYRLILRGLGRSFPPTLDVADARIELEAALKEARLDGKRWGLILDEGHNGTDAILEEVRVLSNRVDAPEGFAGIVLVGQPSLVHRLAQKPLSALASRVIDRVHLRSFGLNETVEYLRLMEPGVSREALDEERIHRSTSGNPRLLALREPVRSKPIRPLRISGQAEPSTLPPTVVQSVLPVRPPLKYAEGMVEVGWEPPVGSEGVEGADDDANVPEGTDAEPAASVAESSGPASIPVPERGETSALDEPIEDYYAALQAWSEWTRNHRRSEPDTRTPSALDDARDATEEEPSSSPEERRGGPREPSSVVSEDPDLRVEPEHGFAPYGQLFSRLREARDPS